jgi:hypothetical protein
MDVIRITAWIVGSLILATIVAAMAATSYEAQTIVGIALWTGLLLWGERLWQARSERTGK